MIDQKKLIRDLMKEIRAANIEKCDEIAIETIQEISNGIVFPYQPFERAFVPFLAVACISIGELLKSHFHVEEAVDSLFKEFPMGLIDIPMILKEDKSDE